MKIAILGWGSLIWDPRNLSIDKDNEHNGWYQDGPKLPIEFSRISSDERLTLVIMKGKIKVATYYALSLYQTLDEAILNLAVREGCGRNKIGQFMKRKKKKVESEKLDCEELIALWLSKKSNFDAVIWTTLNENFKEKTRMNFSRKNVIKYLKDLRADKQAKAEEYIRRAPEQIRTSMRVKIEEELKWLPINLHSNN